MKLRCKIYCIDHGEFICDTMFEHDAPLPSMEIFQSHKGHGIFTFFAAYPKGVNLLDKLQCWKCLQHFSSEQDRDFHQFYCTGTKNAEVDWKVNDCYTEARICASKPITV